MALIQNYEEVCAWCGARCPQNQRYCSRRCQVIRRRLDANGYRAQLEEDSRLWGPPPLMMTIVYLPLCCHLWTQKWFYIVWNGHPNALTKLLISPYFLVFHIPWLIFKGILKFFSSFMNDLHVLGVIVPVGLWCLVVYAFCLLVKENWLREIVGTTLGYYLPTWIFVLCLLLPNLGISPFGAVLALLAFGYPLIRCQTVHFKNLISTKEPFLYSNNPVWDWTELNLEQKFVRVLLILIMRY